MPIKISINMRKALVFFPYPTFPVQSGGQWRCASILKALEVCQYEVTLLTFGKVTDQMRATAAEFGLKKWISNSGMSLPRRAIRKALRTLGVKISQKPPSEDPTWQKVFQQIKHENGSFDLLLVNYANNNWVKSYVEAPLMILDTLDLLSVSKEMNELAFGLVRFEENRLKSWDQQFLDLDCYKSIKIEASEEEAAQCEGYDEVLMIAEKETDAIKSSRPNLSVSLVAPSAPENERSGDYTGLPVFASGPNIFNIQGLIAFQERVLPLILREFPDFQIKVTGRCIHEIPFADQVNYLGLVPSIDAIYQTSGFAVVPTFGGTGQQLKVVEAMGSGLAVVTYKQRVDEGIIEDGVDGFLATDEADFARKVLRLWGDPALRESLGHAAKQKIARDFSQSATNQRFKAVLDKISSRSNGSQEDESCL